MVILKKNSKYIRRYLLLNEHWIWGSPWTNEFIPGASPILQLPLSCGSG